MKQTWWLFLFMVLAIAGAIWLMVGAVDTMMQSANS